MTHVLRFTPTQPQLKEITARTVQARYLFKPNTGVREIVVGCLARAQELHPVLLHGAVFMSNHYHLLLSVTDSKVQADFMRHLNTNLSKEMGRFHKWPGPLFDGRYKGIPVSEEPAAQIDRLRYILSHGCKENLVSSPTEWPGLHCAQALMDGQPVRGQWFDRTQEWHAKRRGEEPALDRFATDYLLSFVHLPCWRHLPEEVARRYVREMVSEIEEETRRRFRRERIRPLEATGVLLRHAHEAPKKPKWSPAPRVHAATKVVRREMIDAYRAFERAYRRASEKLREGDMSAIFPPGSFPPAAPFVFDSS